MVRRLSTVIAALRRLVSPARGHGTPPEHRVECAALINRTHIYMFPRACYRGSAHFAGVSGQVLDKTVDNEPLGRALRETIAASRFITPDDPDFRRIFDSEAVERSWKAWLTNAKARSGYAGKGGFTKRLDLCNVRAADGLVTVSPTRHERPFGWGALRNEPDSTASATSSDAQLGTALRRGFLKCRGYPP